MNVKLLRRIQKQIAKTPKRFQMAEVEEETKCGTAYCIVGWACVLGDPAFNKRTSHPSTSQAADMAEELLEITCEQRMTLWRTSNWPKKFRAKDGSAKLPSLAIARIDHFIATEGRE